MSLSIRPTLGVMSFMDSNGSVIVQDINCTLKETPAGNARRDVLQVTRYKWHCDVVTFNRKLDGEEYSHHYQYLIDKDLVKLNRVRDRIMPLLMEDIRNEGSDSNDLATVCFLMFPFRGADAPIWRHIYFKGHEHSPLLTSMVETFMKGKGMDPWSVYSIRECEALGVDFCTRKEA